MFIIFLLAVYTLLAEKKFLNALPALPTLVAVLTVATGAAPPPVNTVAPANASSSTAIEPSIPTVYALFNKKLLVHAPAPSLELLPIAIAFSNSPAVSKSGA